MKPASFVVVVSHQIFIEAHDVSRVKLKLSFVNEPPTPKGVFEGKTLTNRCAGLSYS